MTPLVAAVTAPSADPWAWQPSPDVWLLVVTLYGGYWYLLATRGGVAVRRVPATAAQRWCYTLGVAVLWAATDGPIDFIGETYLLSVHMLQFLLLTLVAPPLLLLGVPGWMLRRLLAPAPIAALIRALTRPLPAMVLFNAVIVVSHWPTVVDAYLRSDLAHFTMHAVWFSSALLWWWPVLSPLPELPHLTTPLRMAYLFAQSIVPTIPASFLTFGSGPLYDFYAQAPRLWGLSVIDDQQIAGLLMKMGGGLLLWAVITALFFRWSHEDHTGAPDWLYWRDAAPAFERGERNA